ncbi:TPA: hypothetical protein JRX02_001160 [Elizabethkingia anophelis]|uniref:restriction endonuclease subunit S n=1 Tax=Elizabethkingia anophelis TaxID=1117645 RepID=UPI00296E1B4D|nr:restriction endonuclease subunit S [Elizabethkingia anophelis]HAY3503375.1 hypothetical protein [Elizabethkingia anophelis]HAY3510686.1 hypothetical protein [Elizabethkingia anophelis]HAY3514767.1 hypothetical protein [Elizabethkingia anophelis]HAY3518669.1 hypothetical protein [Elizabethkingia anophelis]
MENKLPKNWVKINLKDSVNFRKGKKPKILSEENFESSLPYMDIQALESGIVRYFADKNSSKHFKENDVVIVWDGSRSGLILKPKKGAIGSTLGALNPYTYKSEYLYYFLLSQYEIINSKARGVGIPHVDPTYLWGLSLPLPPLPEQERIVTKLDALFAQHEAMKKALEHIPQLLKDFRQQVLIQATNGKLTKKWRDENGIKDWVSVIINDICESIVPGRDKPKSFTGTIPWITTPNLTSRYIDKSSTNLFLSDKEILEVRAKKIPINSVIMTIIGKFGISAIVKEECVINQQLHAFLPSNKIIPEFLSYIIFTKTEYLESISSATTIAYINKTKANSLPINLPPLKEQQEIVSRVESLFDKADTIEKRYKTLKEKIDSLPQAILHKAFKGELVPQLPTDGDAKDLLEEILKLKKEVKKK